MPRLWDDMGERKMDFITSFVKSTLLRGYVITRRYNNLHGGYLHVGDSKHHSDIRLGVCHGFLIGERMPR